MSVTTAKKKLSTGESTSYENHSADSILDSGFIKQDKECLKFLKKQHSF